MSQAKVVWCGHRSYSFPFSYFRRKRTGHYDKVKDIGRIPFQI